MKIPSLQTLWQEISRVFARFPLQILFALIAMVTCWHLIDSSVNEDLSKLVLICNLGLTLALATDLFSESNDYTNIKKWALRIGVVAICALLYFTLTPATYTNDIFKILLLGFAFHLLVSFAPFINNKNLDGFWQYNKTIFLRILTAGFYSAVLFVGLSVALMAINGLFNAQIKEGTYGKLFCFIGIGFTTVFFLAGVPNNFNSLNQDQTYPKALKVFTQYVLIPLMTIYLAILLVYETKIIVLWALPKGLVSGLILAYSVFGILSLLLVFPIKDKEGNSWIKLFSKFFYLMMIPLVLLLLVAIFTRIDLYGITEFRYILIALAFWLSAITAYFLISKKQNIKIIPISLCLVALLATYGPQSAFSVAKYSQIARLKKLMNSKKRNDKQEVSSIIKYLVTQHGLTALQSFTKINLDSLKQSITTNIKNKKLSRYELKEMQIDTAKKLLNIEDTEEAYVKSNHLQVKNQNDGLVIIKGYDAIYEVSNNTNATFKIDNLNIEIKFDDETRQVLILNIRNEKPIEFKIVSLAEQISKANDKQELAKNDQDDYIYPSGKMQISKTSKNYSFKLILNNINQYYEYDNKVNWLNFEGYLLVKRN